MGKATGKCSSVLRQHNIILVTKYTPRQTQLKWVKQLESKCAKFVIPCLQLLDQTLDMS